MKTSTKIFSKLALTVGSLLFALNAVAANWYVDKDARGANNGGSWSNAWSSFAAIDWNRLAAGDVLYISGGSTTKTYNETLMIVNHVTAENQRIYIKPGGAEPNAATAHSGVVVITAPGPGIQMGNNSARFARYVTIDGNVNGQRRIKIMNCADGGVRTRYAGSDGNHYRYLEIGYNGNATTAPNQQNGITLNQRDTGVVIGHCYIHRNKGDGINQAVQTIDRYARVVIHDTTIEANRDDSIQMNGAVDVLNCVLNGGGDPNWWFLPNAHPDGIQTNDGYWRIYGNLIHSHTQEIFIEAFNVLSINHIQICNNVIYDTTSPHSVAIIFRANMGGTHEWRDILIANNTFMNASIGIRWLIDSRATLNLYDTRVINNIFTNNGQLVFNGTANYNTQRFVLEHNVFNGSDSIWYNGTQYSSANALNAATGFKGNTNAPVAFQSGSFNYRLAATDTAARDKGMTLSNYFTVDIEGKARPASGWDIGAYEYGGSTAPVLTPPAAPKNLRVVPQ